jgi:para-nitrobenzyl esterase
VIKYFSFFVVILGACSNIPERGSTGADAKFLSVQTSSGIVTGTISDVNEKAVDWFDIPYAEPPVGDLRWRAPRSLNSPDHKITNREDNACVQEASEYAGVSGSGIVGSEDCLYLDITAPIDFKEVSYPVMFWIHGGGNTSGLKDYYDFSNFAATKGLVIVALNYRLGALGWFSHPAIQETQSGLDKASNFGTLDIIEALKWVKNNIKKFGGDPSNVTVFGESAGGHNVLALLASPLSENLFQKAISQSGYTATSTYERAHNRSNAFPLVKRGSWQITKDLLFDQHSLTDQKNILKNLDAREFIGRYSRENQIDSIPLSTRDGVVIPLEGIASALGNPRYAKKIPVMSGTTKDEVSLWHGLHRYFVDIKYPLSRFLPPFYSIKDQGVFDLWIRTRSHAWKIRGSDEPLGALQRAGYTELYSYQFDWDHQKPSIFADFPSILGATHGIEIAFLTQDYRFGPISSYIYPQGSARDEMEETMMSAWADFAKTANPSASIPVVWPIYNEQSATFMRLDINDLLRTDSEKYTLDSLLEEVLSKPEATQLEKCLMVWESLVNIGDVSLELLETLGGGTCAKYDLLAEQQKIRDFFVENFGSVSVR